ncbi:UNVERIFIED_CONTAM: transmembrane protein, putative [Hammondia hammondi]|eukprot:XP_008882602.1 transmembrane protein, putative [Hammondia hammondi]
MVLTIIEAIALGGADVGVYLTVLAAWSPNLGMGVVNHLWVMPLGFLVECLRCSQAVVCAIKGGLWHEKCNLIIAAVANQVFIYGTELAAVVVAPIFVMGVILGEHTRNEVSKHSGNLMKVQGRH